MSIEHRHIILVAPWYYGLERSLMRAFQRHDATVQPFVYFPHDRLDQKIRNRLIENVSPEIGLSAARAARHRAFERRLLDAVRNSSPDTLVVVVKGDILAADTVETLTRTRETVYWGIDDPRRFPTVMEALSLYHRRYCFERGVASALTNDGWPTSHLPNGYDDEVFVPGPPDVEIGDVQVSFVGARYPERERLLLDMVGAFELGIWGGDWKRRPWRRRFYQVRTPLDQAVRGQAAHSGADVYRTVPVNLNVHGLGTGVNTRTFEIPGAGGFQLCDLRPGIEEFFEPDKEIVLFADSTELMDKTAFYLRHTEARTLIANRGQHRAVTQHTWFLRVREILDPGPEG